MKGDDIMTKHKRKISIDKATGIRITVLLIALTNQALVVFGLSPIPFTLAEIEAGVATVFSVISTIWATYRNNDITPEAREGTRVTRELKADKKRKEGGK